MAYGLLSGRYAVPDDSVVTAENEDDATPARRFQKGVPPNMFKQLIGKNHQEFSTLRQQDSLEFFQHFMAAMQALERRHPELQVANIFDFTMSSRLQCSGCRGIKVTENTTSLIPLQIPAERDEAGKYKDQSLERCIDLAFGRDELEFTCPQCGGKKAATR